MILTVQVRPKRYNLIFGVNTNLTTIALSQHVREGTVVAVIGPPGQQGLKGDKGDTGAFPTSIDGGNF